MRGPRLLKQSSDDDSNARAMLPDHNLLVAVIIRAMLDTCFTRDMLRSYHTNGDYYRMDKSRDSARAWLTSDSNDPFSFNWCLDHLSWRFNTDLLRENARRIIECDQSAFTELRRWRSRA